MDVVDAKPKKTWVRTTIGELKNVQRVFSTSNPLGIQEAKRKGISKETMSMYGRVGPKMSALLEQIRSNTKTLDVTEELIQARAVHNEKWQLYNLVFEDETMPQEAKKQALQLAGEILIASLDNVTKILERGARIMAAQTDDMSPHTVDIVVKQLCGFVYKCFDSETDRTNIIKFDKMLNEELRLPTLKSLGTMITPDQQVRAMDDSIPFVEETATSTAS